MGIPKRNTGFSVVMAAFGLLLLGGMAATTVTLLSNIQEERGGALLTEQAFALAQAGIEYAKFRIDQGLDPVVTNAPLAPGTFTIGADPMTGSLFVTGQAGAARRTYRLTTTFSRNCVELDVTHAHVAANNLVGMKLAKHCLSKAAITHWMIAWTPTYQERSIRLQITGDQLMTLYDHPIGYPSGERIDAVDFLLTRNTGYYPINKVAFQNALPTGKTYTVTLYLADGCVIAKTFRDASGNAGPGGPPGGGANPLAGPGFTMSGNGQIVVAPNRQVEVKALCTHLMSEHEGSAIPIRAWLRVDDAYYTPLFGGTAMSGGESQRVTTGPGGKQYVIRANAQSGSFNATYESTNTAQVKQLVNQSPLPTREGFAGQPSVAQCLQPYWDGSMQRMVLAPNQILLLFELGINVSAQPRNPAVDFQDLVLLLTVQ